MLTLESSKSNRLEDVFADWEAGMSLGLKSSQARPSCSASGSELEQQPWFLKEVFYFIYFMLAIYLLWFGASPTV